MFYGIRKNFQVALLVVCLSPVYANCPDGLEVAKLIAKLRVIGKAILSIEEIE